MNKKQMYVLLAGFLASLGAHAQKNPDLVADEVVVTTTRFEEKSSDQPVNVQVITAEQIRQSGVRSLPELLSQQAGIYTRNSGGNPNRQIDMRGFGIFGDQNSLILVDGQRINENEQTSTNLTGIALSSIERIEIVRGSGGAVLYGAGATGGTINIVTKGPRPQDRQGYVKGGVGNYGTTSIGAGGSIAGDKVGLTIDADKYDSDNYRDNNEVTQKNVNLGLHYFGDRGPVALKYSHSEQELRFPGARTEAQLTTNRRGTSTPDDSGSLDSDRVFLTTTQSYDFGQLGLDVGHRERQNIGRFPSQFNNVDTHTRVTSVSPRVKLPFQLFGRNNALVAGLDWEKWDYDSTADFPGNTLSSQENKAVYVKDTLDITDSTTFSVGGRVQRSETTYEVLGFFAVPEQTQNSELHAYDIALRQALGSQWSVYARTGRSFRLANVDDNFLITTLLKPQTSNDQEVGADYSSERASVKIAAYQMRLENEIAFLPGNVLPPFGSNVNLPPTERKGIEIDGAWAFSDAWRASANYTYTTAKFREGSFGGFDIAGKNIPLVPKHRANAMLTWKPVPNASLSGRVSYTGEQYFDNDQSNTFGRKMPDYTVTDLIAGYDIGNWRLGAAIYNLFNEQYFSYAIRGAALTTFNAYPEAERSYMISAEYHFGK